MRVFGFSVLALSLLSACAPTPVAQVSKGGALPTALPGARAAEQPPLLAVAPSRTVHSNADLARAFLALEFRMESGRPLPVLTRFEGPLTLATAGPVPAAAAPELARLIARLRSEAGLDIRSAAPGAGASVTVEFVPRARLRRTAQGAACFVAPNVGSLADYRRGGAEADWARLSTRQQVRVFIPADAPPQELRDCLHEEIAQGLGPLNDLYQLTDSVYNDDNFQTVLTGFDMMMLRMHYAPELASGMSRAEVAAQLPAVLARLNPGGGPVGAMPDLPGAPAWTAAVDTALGPGGQAAEGRAAAAARMVALAEGAGWQDGRLAFSLYALGRARLTSDPVAAEGALARARSIWQGLPGGAIYVAHADMQLAALALTTGQPDQALARTAAALPAARASGNGALMATLLMIRAEALDALGRPAEARAARLDSDPWARYGFGSTDHIRARQGDIAALAARGAGRG